MLALGDILQKIPNYPGIGQTLAEISEPVRGRLPVGVS
jgi:hypothetical protein